MAPFELTRAVTYPYSFSPAHQHFRSTPLRMAPYSAACIPYRWMLRDYRLYDIDQTINRRLVYGLLTLGTRASQRRVARGDWRRTTTRC
jgi:hypothetical protein